MRARRRHGLSRLPQRRLRFIPRRHRVPELLGLLRQRDAALGLLGPRRRRRVFVQRRLRGLGPELHVLPTVWIRHVQRVPVESLVVPDLPGVPGLPGQPVPARLRPVQRGRRLHAVRHHPVLLRLLFVQLREPIRRELLEMRAQLQRGLLHRELWGSEPRFLPGLPARLVR